MGESFANKKNDRYSNPSKSKQITSDCSVVLLYVNYNGQCHGADGMKVQGMAELKCQRNGCHQTLSITIHNPMEQNDPPSNELGSKVSPKAPKSPKRRTKVS